MPELPEVESARSVVERFALRRRIVEVDDTDAYVCRPHHCGELRNALLGDSLLSAHRRGKSMWCDTGSGLTLGIHLGMSGKIVIADADGTEIGGGDNWEFGREPGDYRFSRFALTFSDGTTLRLVDPRRLGRVRLDPPLSELGPDAADISSAEFLEAVRSGRTPVKARLLDQRAVAGIGNLLADEILWRAELNPARPVDSLTADERAQLYRSVTTTIDEALRQGGVHTLPLVGRGTRGGRCPHDGTTLAMSTVGGRTSYWCPTEQPRLPRDAQPGGRAG